MTGRGRHVQRGDVAASSAHWGQQGLRALAPLSKPNSMPSAEELVNDSPAWRSRRAPVRRGSGGFADTAGDGAGVHQLLLIMMHIRTGQGDRSSRARLAEVKTNPDLRFLF